MRTNFQMVSNIYDKFKPAQRGFLTGEEADMITEELCLKEMDLLQLRNLRDFVVLYFNSMRNNTSTDELMRNMDICSGICAVIDTEIFNNGGEV